jgi:hypothetical protein
VDDWRGEASYWETRVLIAVEDFERGVPIQFLVSERQGF